MAPGASGDESSSISSRMRRAGRRDKQRLRHVVIPAEAVTIGRCADTMDYRFRRRP